jgi:hypothetical protein
MDVNPVAGQSTHSSQLSQVVQVGVHTGVGVVHSGVGVTGIGVTGGTIIVSQLCSKHSHPHVKQGDSLQSHPQVSCFSFKPPHNEHP